MTKPKGLKFKKANPKILPALGGLKKSYIRKSHCLKKTLLFLVKKLKLIEEKGSLGDKEKIGIKQIKEDMIRLSEYEKLKKYEFYLNCLSIINHY